MANFLIQKATQTDFEQVVQWAENEGWNPGLDDLETFYQTDPDGFLVGILDDKIIASISVVKYNQAYGFLGFYITDQTYRGQGYGIQVWTKGIEYLKSATIGLDGVVDQQDNYIASGFEFFGRNIRYSGVPKSTHIQNQDVTIQTISKNDFSWINALDQKCFGCDRQLFLRNWISWQDQNRQTLAVYKNAKPCGFGTIRKCKSGYKIGPLFSTDSDAASLLFDALSNLTPENSEITLDVPEQNARAIELANSFDLQPVFETARMYKGPRPPITWQNVFGITTLELG
jgi:predicted GNAT family N-acyltransferase